MDTGKSQRASDWQYPSWQRNQWITWSELQLSGEAKRRLAAAVLACGILVVLAFKLIATNAAHSVLDKPSDKCVLGLLGHMCCSTLLQQAVRPHTQAASSESSHPCQTPHSPICRKAGGWKGGDDGTSGRKRNTADALMAKSSAQTRANAGVAATAASTLLGNGVNRGASEPGRARLEVGKRHTRIHGHST
jgi:hypothetical protein